MDPQAVMLASGSQAPPQVAPVGHAGSPESAVPQLSPGGGELDVLLLHAPTMASRGTAKRTKRAKLKVFMSVV